MVPPNPRQVGVNCLIAGFVFAHIDFVCGCWRSALLDQHDLRQSETLNSSNPMKNWFGLRRSFADTLSITMPRAWSDKPVY